MSGELRSEHRMRCGRCGAEAEVPTVRGMRLDQPSGWVMLAVHGSNPDLRRRLCADCFMDLVDFLEPEQVVRVTAIAP